MRPPLPSVIPLIIANILPLFGVLFFDWSLFEILFLYWCESGIIAFYNILKLIKISRILSIFLVPFFIIHFGGFMIGHIIFIFTLFPPEIGLDSSSLFPSLKALAFFFASLALPILGLFISHGISYFSNFVRNQEYINMDIKGQMTAPYKRVIIMHLTIIFGGWLITIFNQPILGLIFLILLKSIIDIHSHTREHSLSKVSPL